MVALVAGATGRTGAEIVKRLVKEGVQVKVSFEQVAERFLHTRRL